VVEELVHLDSLVHSSTQSSPDISLCIAHAAMQNLNIWKLSISIKLKLYNTAFYPSCTALSAGQSPREMYSRLMLSIKGV